MKPPIVLLTGASGSVGTRFQQLLYTKLEIVPFAGNVCDEDAVVAAVRDSRCDSVVHLASKTHIDRCEADRNQGQAGAVWQTNVRGTAHLVAACDRFKRYLLMVSTECVFDGEKGNYRETDIPHPINWYGETKLQAEAFVLPSPFGLILRAVLAYGYSEVSSYDLVGQIRRHLKSGKPFSVVSDQQMNPTFIDDLIYCLHDCIQQRYTGILHYGGAQTYTPYALAKLIARNMRIRADCIQPVTLAEYFGTAARLRLKQGTLNCQKITGVLGIPASDTEQALSALAKRS